MTISCEHEDRSKLLNAYSQCMENVLSQQFMYCLIFIYEGLSPHRNLHFYKKFTLQCFICKCHYLTIKAEYLLIKHLGDMNMYGSCAGCFLFSSYFLSALSFLEVSCTSAKSLLTKHKSTIPVTLGI